MEEPVVLTQENWKRIVLEIFKQDQEIAGLRHDVQMAENAADSYRHHYEMSEERKRLDQAAVRASEQARILAWFEAQRFMPMMLLTGRAIANRLRKVLPSA